MASPFTHTLRSLDSDGARRVTVGLLLGGLLLAGWLAWFFLGAVSVHEVTDAARLEVKSAAHPVAARLDGQVISTCLEIGREVRSGEVLVQLDSGPEMLALEEGKARALDLRARIEALRSEIRAEEESAAAHLKAGDIAIAESKARVTEAEARAEFVERQAQVLASLEEGKAVSEEALRQARTEAAASRAGVEALKLAVSRLEQDRAVEAADRRARLAKLTREAVELEGLTAIEEASNRRLEREIELRTIRAPTDGLVGEARELRAGSVVRTGEKLGSIVPPGEPRAVAFFPVSGVGRIRPGQPAYLRMDGFPWTRYGTLAATVTSFASEPVDGRVRVELALEPNEGSEIPLEHGITGAAEIEVERISPAKLVLRAAGELLGPRRETGPARG